MIPKIIHQVWMQGWINLPAKYLSNVQSIIDKNIGWQHIKWDEISIRELIKSLGDEYLVKYDSFKLLHQRVDFARYAILYVNGGVSVDVDVVALKSLDEVPHINDSNFIVSSNSINSFINNATILVSKNNSLMKEFLDTIVSNCKIYQSDTVCIFNTTGPMAFTKFINDHKSEVTILDYSYLEPCSGMNKYCDVKPNSILDHQHEGSWVSPFYKNLTKSYYFLKQYRIVLGVALVLIILLIALRK